VSNKREDIRTAAIAAIQTIVGSSYVVEKYEGDPQAMKETTSARVYVQYDAAKMGESLEVGRTTYEKTFYYLVIIPAADTASQTATKTALQILEDIEKGLSGQVLAEFGQIMPAELPGTDLFEILDSNTYGRACYVQAWKVQGVESH